MVYFFTNNKRLLAYLIFYWTYFLTVFRTWEYLDQPVFVGLYTLDAFYIIDFLYQCIKEKMNDEKLNELHKEAYKQSVLRKDIVNSLQLNPLEIKLPKERLYKAEKELYLSALKGWLAFSILPKAIFVALGFVNGHSLTDGNPIIIVPICLCLLELIIIIDVYLVSVSNKRLNIPEKVGIYFDKIVIGEDTFNLDEIKKVTMTYFERYEENVFLHDKIRRVVIETEDGKKKYRLGRMGKKNFNAYWGKYDEFATALYDWCMAKNIDVSFEFKSVMEIKND